MISNSCTMRTFSLILFLIGNIAFTSSQTYKRVLDSDTVIWNFLSDRSCGDCLETLYQKAFGDTVFNGLHYSKLTFGIVGYNTKADYDTDGFIREDTVNGRLYVLNYTYDCKDTPCQENIVYDMGLNIGDTLEYENSQNNIPMVVAEIDTIEGRKVISFLKDSDNGLKFIEGIGPTREMLYDTYPAFSSFSELLCVSKDKDFQYRTFWGSVYGCSAFIGLGLASEGEVDICIEPNPVRLNQSIRIKNGKNHLVQIQIFNLSGRLLYTTKALSTTEFTTDVFTSKPGIFIFQIKRLNSNHSDRGILSVY